MKLLVLCLTFISSNSFGQYLFSEARFEPNKRWLDHNKKDQKENVRNLLKKLVKSKSGKDLVLKANEKAKESGLNIYDIIDAGNGSLTDTTLIRKFSQHTPNKVKYETRSKVYINRELNQYDALLDLAHELTHYVYRDAFNPYENSFTLEQFIENTIEGKGGEVQAFLMECKIHNELFPNQNSGRYNCQKIVDKKTGRISYELAVKRFYNVGDYYESFSKTLTKHGIRRHFPHVSPSKTSFVSSAYGIPYPVAAFEEYLSVLNKVCENDKNRLSYFKKSKGRAPASVNITEFEENYNRRCKGIFLY